MSLESEHITILAFFPLDKEIEELKLAQQRELDLSKKEAELAAEMKFGDGLTEARKAYAALKHLLDSQVTNLTLFLYTGVVIKTPFQRSHGIFLVGECSCRKYGKTSSRTGS